MQHTEAKRNVVPQPTRAQNEFLFTVFMVLVVLAVVLGFTVPKSVSAEPLDRLRWKAPPAVVADVLIRAVDGRVADDRCLNARTDLNVREMVHVDRKDHVQGMSLLVSTADALRPNGHTPD